MSTCSLIIDDGNICGESPLWDATQQKLYWTDNVGCKFYGYDWKTKQRQTLLVDFEVNGCALDQSGGFTFINNSGVWFWNRKDGPALIVREGSVDAYIEFCRRETRALLLNHAAAVLAIADALIRHRTINRIQIADYVEQMKFLADFEHRSPPSSLAWDCARAG